VATTAAALLAVGGAAAAASGIGLGGGDGAPTATDRNLPPATAKVTRQTLIDTQSGTGQLGYGGQNTISALLAGTLTALPRIGSTVARGKTLYRIDNEPVVLLYGSLPAYRTLSPGAKGSDVKQFERNLWALGYRGFTVDQSFTADTASAVKKWQQDLGLPQTGEVEQGRIAYATGPVRVSARKAAVGDPVQPRATLLTCTNRSRVINVQLDLSDGPLAHQGSPVTVRLPNDKTVTGRITSTETVIDTGNDGTSDPTTKIKVTIAVPRAKALEGLDEASVTVAFQTAMRKNVLTVPVTALLALSEGGYGVQVVTGTSTRIIAVQTGLFAGGQVEVSGDGLTEGMTVGVPS
jgi:membrane fusion protein, multidrug efflux system